MTDLKSILDRVYVSTYRYGDSPDVNVLLHDRDTDLVCLGTNGDPVFYDCYAAFEADNAACMGDYHFVVEYYSVTEYLLDHNLDVYICDDDDLVDEVRSILGIGEADWLLGLAANA